MTPRTDVRTRRGTQRRIQNRPGAINLTVSCGGVAIGPGDIVVGDRDGVVAVPLEETQRVAAQLKVVKQKEAEAENKVRRGEKLKFWDEAALRAKGAVRYVD